MSTIAHRIYITTLVLIVVITTFFLFFKGLPYYGTPLEERFYHPDHEWFKPSGVFGHGLGIVGTLLILIGVFGYMAKKKYKALQRYGRLKYWLEFHIFLCTLGPIMILFHTAFKFGGLVSVSFWSMVAVVASGVIGRFIYIQIPRSIEGRALSLNEIQSMKIDLEEQLKQSYQLDDTSIQQILQTTTSHQQLGFVGQFLEDRKKINYIKKILKTARLAPIHVKNIMSLIKNEISLNNRLGRLQTMQQLFKYWHVAHLPFALIMLIIMVIHVGVTLALGYRWIF